MTSFRARDGLVIILIIIGTCIAQGNAECIMNFTSELDVTSPLIILKDAAVSDGTSFLLPTATSPVTTLSNGEEVTLLCPGNSNRLSVSGTTRQTNEATLACDSGFNFQLNGQSVLISDLRCTDIPQSAIRNVGTCSSRHNRLQIGYETSDKFIRLIDICFDDTNYTTSYVNYTLVAGIEKRQRNQQTRNFDETDYYNNLPNSPETYYTCSNQQRVIGASIGTSRVDRYIKCSNDINYLTKSHLADTFDFFYGAQQRSSMYHVNVVPMWLSIRNGNWMKLAEEIRQYASNTSRRASDLIVYSGTLGVANFNNRVIYLGTDNNGRPVIPVPKWIWKLVYEPDTKEGIVFLVINNPYMRYFACKCVCAQTKWTLAWNRRDQNKGYVYCCKISNFRMAFSGLPNFEDRGILTKNRTYKPDLDVPAQ